jgi:putative tributyrin esterase
MASIEFKERFAPIGLSDPALEYGHIRNLTFHSEALRGRGDVSLFVPPECLSLTNVPLVVLLHGVYGSHWAWFMKGAAHLTAQRLIAAGTIRPMILAAPSDGLTGDGTGYLPYRHTDYERWIVEDVVDCVQQLYPCTAPAKTVSITGLSMGGFGALRLGAKYPERFRAISAHSSITHISQFDQFVRHPMNTGSMPAEEPDIVYWISKNRNRLPPLRFDCGRSDTLFPANQALHAKLDSLAIPHQFDSFNGEHTWSYWMTHLEDSLIFFEHVIAQNVIETHNSGVSGSTELRRAGK